MAMALQSQRRQAHSPGSCLAVLLLLLLLLSCTLVQHVNAECKGATNCKVVTTTPTVQCANPPTLASVVKFDGKDYE